MLAHFMLHLRHLVARDGNFSKRSGAGYVPNLILEPLYFGREVNYVCSLLPSRYVITIRILQLVSWQLPTDVAASANALAVRNKLLFADQGETVLEVLYVILRLVILRPS